MANLGQLVVNLEANIARFTQDMSRASQVTEQAMSRMQGAADKVNNVLNLIGVGLSVDLLVGEVNRTLDSLAALDDMAQKTGSSVETLSKLSKVASFTGTDLGSVDGMLVKLSKNLNEVEEKSNKTAKALAAIGISTKDIKDQDAAQVFVQVARKLQDYEDGAGKVALVTDLMGKSAADMLPYMNDVAESIDQFASDSTEAAANAAALQDELGRLKVKYEDVRDGIIIAALPAAIDFIGALQDTKREADSLTDDTNVDTWADGAAIGLARMADFATVTAKTLSALSGSVRVVTMDIARWATLQPSNMAKLIAQGKNPLADFNALYEEREKVIADADKRWEKLGNIDTEALEKRVRGRIDERQLLARINAEIDGPMGGGWTPSATSRSDLKYSSSDGKKDKDKDKEWSREAAADRMVKLALDETLAMRNTEKATEDLIEAEMRRMEQQSRAAERIAVDAEQIRQSLMTDVEHEQFAYETRVQQLQAFGALKLENEIVANALIEAETARHIQAKADLQAAHDTQMLGMMGNSADQLYSLMQRAGMEQTALGKAVFLASKAIAVAEIIMNTEVAASKAQAQFGVYGTPIAMAIRVAGYASAGLVAGMAVAEASAEGGYDIPAGVNPVTQLHEKEMVLPKAQAEVIRGLAANGGAGGGDFKLTLISNGTPQRVVETQRVSPWEWAMIVEDAKNATAAAFSDPNSKPSREIQRNFGIQRSR